MSNGNLSGKDLGNEITTFVNGFGCDSEGVAETVARSHKTLQQSTMRLMMTIIRRLAQNSTDDRNEATVQLAKKITEIAKDYPLPLI